MMRHRMLVAAALGLVSMLVPAERAGAQQQTDSLGQRVQRMVSDGDRDRARALVDSVLFTLTEGTPAYADALYWRAYSVRDAAEAERGYLRVAIEYPMSPRAEDALFALAQLRRARGDRMGERRLLDRLLREHPGGRRVPAAGHRLAQVAFEDGDAVAACAAISTARARVSRNDVELSNQIEYFVPRCNALTAADSARAAGDSSETPGIESGDPGFSIQVAAFNAKRDADLLMRRLNGRGFDVRVVGTRAPYRVRIGRYATREDATDALARVKRAGLAQARVVEAEPR
jgi:hypothetical protein